MRLRVFIDTNLFVSAALLPRGAPYQLFQAWETGSFQLLSSAYQIREIQIALSRPKVARYGVSTSQVTSLLRRLEQHASMVTVQEPGLVHVRDSKDELILAAALNGQADYLLTGDIDLLVLDGDPRLGTLRITTARAFLDILQGDAERR